MLSCPVRHSKHFASLFAIYPKCLSLNLFLSLSGQRQPSTCSMMHCSQHTCPQLIQQPSVQEHPLRPNRCTIGTLTVLYTLETDALSLYVLEIQLRRYSLGGYRLDCGKSSSVCTSSQNGMSNDDYFWAIFQRLLSFYKIQAIYLSASLIQMSFSFLSFLSYLSFFVSSLMSASMPFLPSSASLLSLLPSIQVSLSSEYQCLPRSFLETQYLNRYQMSYLSCLNTHSVRFIVRTVVNSSRNYTNMLSFLNLRMLGLSYLLRLSIKNQGFAYINLPIKGQYFDIWWLNTYSSTDHSVLRSVWHINPQLVPRSTPSWIAKYRTPKHYCLAMARQPMVRQRTSWQNIFFVKKTSSYYNLIVMSLFSLNLSHMPVSIPFLPLTVTSQIH